MAFLIIEAGRLQLAKLFNKVLEGITNSWISGHGEDIFAQVKFSHVLQILWRWPSLQLICRVSSLLLWSGRRPRWTTLIVVRVYSALSKAHLALSSSHQHHVHFVNDKKPQVKVKSLSQVMELGPLNLVFLPPERCNEEFTPRLTEDDVIGLSQRGSPGMAKKFLKGRCLLICRLTE